MEEFHYFLEVFISNHVSKTTLEWDQVVPLFCAAYNLLSNEHSQERLFFSCIWT